MRIFLDPGHNHSGADTGAQGNGLKEQDITFLIASRVREKLQPMGFEVQMSRNAITDNVGHGTTLSSLSARTNAANRWGADLFVSIHANAGGGKGSETYCYQSGITNGCRLASTVQHRLSAIPGLNSRGVKVNQNLAVLRTSHMPAILVETAFLDHAKDAEFLGSKKGQEQLASAIAHGICDYAGIESYEEELNMTQYEELKQSIQDLTETVKIMAVELENLKHPMIYDYIDSNMPEYARPIIQKLVNAGVLQGNGGGLGLTEELLRMLVILDRMTEKNSEYVPVSTK